MHNLDKTQAEKSSYHYATYSACIIFSFLTYARGQLNWEKVQLMYILNLLDSLEMGKCSSSRNLACSEIKRTTSST